MPPRLVITAGPTHEPIDAVRYLGNRSSGRVGVSLADAGDARGWQTTLLLGPGELKPSRPGVNLVRFRTCDDLRALLHTHVPEADVLIMAAAVADYRPKPLAALSGGKFRRTSEKLMLELEPTPDLIAERSALREPGQYFVGFALEPREEMIASGLKKLERKRLDLVVANPLESMGADQIEAVALSKSGERIDTPGRISKPDFARWLLDVIGARAPRLGMAESADRKDPRS